MRTALTFALFAVGISWGLTVGAHAQSFGVTPPATSPQSATSALCGWIVVKYKPDVPTAQRNVKWYLIKDGEEGPKKVGAGNPCEKEKGDYGIRFERGTVKKYVTFPLDPKTQVLIWVKKS